MRDIIKRFLSLFDDRLGCFKFLISLSLLSADFLVLGLEEGFHLGSVSLLLARDFSLGIDVFDHLLNNSLLFSDVGVLHTELLRKHSCILSSLRKRGQTTLETRH